MDLGVQDHPPPKFTFSLAFSQVLYFNIIEKCKNMDKCGTNFLLKSQFLGNMPSKTSDCKYASHLSRAWKAHRYLSNYYIHPLYRSGQGSQHSQIAAGLSNTGWTMSSIWSSSSASRKYYSSPMWTNSLMMSSASFVINSKICSRKATTIR